MEVELEKKSKRDGKSYPELASLLCIAHAEKTGCSVSHSRLELQTCSECLLRHGIHPNRLAAGLPDILEELAPVMDSDDELRSGFSGASARDIGIA